MHIISKKKLRELWEKYPRAKSALEQWYQVAKNAEWENFADVRKTFNTADQVGKFTVFDIGGNKYRLPTNIPINHFTPEDPGRTSCSTTSNRMRSAGNYAVSLGYKSRHTGGVNFVFADGSVRFVGQFISQETYTYLSWRNDGRVIPNF